MDLSLIQAHSAPSGKVADGLAEFETYIRNNCEFIPNFGEQGVTARRVPLPEGRDSNSFFVQGGNASHFQLLLEAAQP
jgi:hypothetical protein